ncbi:MAG: acylglycerol kinase family protein, partial [Prolixibacteraceae bacterium]|nr:acylglycerol kinase family protein [Prolixibacteraceae bacterium]
MEYKQIDKWLVVLNPNAGGKSAKEQWPAIKSELKKQGFSFDTSKTKHRNHAIQIVQEKIARGYRNIIVIGGDGTLHEVVNG